MQTCISAFSWSNSIISIREAKVIPKTNEMEWKNKYICVEGMYRSSLQDITLNGFHSKRMFKTGCRTLYLIAAKSISTLVG